MSHAKFWLFGAAALMLLTPAGAGAQTAQWDQTVQKAKGQTLRVLHQGVTKAFDTMIDEFTKKYGIKVDATVSRPSQALSRIRTEQNNGQYLWDVWWAITANMTQVASPAGMFSKFEDFLMLPEVKDVANWRHPDYIYGDNARGVFTYSHEVNFSSYRNDANLKGVKVDTIDSLMNPALKGKVVLRDASVPNAGSFALAPMYKAKGGDFVMRFLKEMNPRTYENPEQLDTAIIRGGAAVVFGMQGAAFSQCRADGGCKTIHEITSMPTAVSRGLAVFKNPPHREATIVFLNWLLSKEGQSMLVNEWVKDNSSGAVSMRKDVAPHPKHASDLPDFTDPEKYAWVSSQKGADEIKAVVKIFKDWSGK